MLWFSFLLGRFRLSDPGGSLNLNREWARKSVVDSVWIPDIYACMKGGFGTLLRFE